MTIGTASTRISVFFRAISVPFNFLSKFPAQWFAQPRSQGLSFLPSAGETRRETLGIRLWFPLRNIGNFQTRNLFQEISVPEFLVEWKAPSVLRENYFIIDGDILSFIVFVCFFTYSVKRFFFHGREGHCASEPEFCVSFVKELGVSNLVSLCKVTTS